MEVSFRGVAAIIEGLTRLNERKARTLELEREAELIRANDRRSDALKEVRDDDFRAHDLPLDAVLVLQKSMEVRKDDVADEENRADNRRADERYETNREDDE